MEVRWVQDLRVLVVRWDLWVQDPLNLGVLPGRQWGQELLLQQQVLRRQLLHQRLAQQQQQVQQEARG